MKAQLAQLRNVLAEGWVEPLYPGVCLAVHRSNAAELAESGAGGLLRIVFAVGINPDTNHEYVEYMNMDVVVANDILTDFANLSRCLPIPCTLHLRSTWTTPTYDVERTCQIDASGNVKEFVRKITDTASAFFRSQYRTYVNGLADAGYFDCTDWETPAAKHFLEHLQVRSCLSAAG